MSVAGWIYWRDNPPPKDTTVSACWSVTDEPIAVTTCKRGCCVRHNGNNLMLPNWWKPVAASEIEKQGE